MKTSIFGRIKVLGGLSYQVGVYNTCQLFHVVFRYSVITTGSNSYCSLFLFLSVSFFLPFSLAIHLYKCAVNELCNACCPEYFNEIWIYRSQYVWYDLHINRYWIWFCFFLFFELLLTVLLLSNDNIDMWELNALSMLTVFRLQLRMNAYRFCCDVWIGRR